jgi:hypothetical protein
MPNSGAEAANQYDSWQSQGPSLAHLRAHCTWHLLALSTLIRCGIIFLTLVMICAHFDLQCFFQMTTQSRHTHKSLVDFLELTPAFLCGSKFPKNVALSFLCRLGLSRNDPT